MTLSVATLRVPARFRLADVNTLRRRIDPVDSFDKMPLLPSVRQALNELQVHKPTHTQSISIPRLTELFHKQQQQNWTAVLSAETGTGKTLSYLLPVMQQLKREEEPTEPNQPRTVFNYIRAAIILPTNELVEQVYRTTKTVAHNIKLRVDKLGHGHQHRLPCDVIVGTPSKLLRMPFAERRSINHVVIDESDTLLSDPEFKQQIDELLANVKLQSLIYCSATITDAMLKAVNTDDNNTVFITTPQLHQTKPKVAVKTIVVKLPEIGRFKEILKQIDSKEKTIVFCNSTAVGQRLYSFMQSSRMTPVFLHGGIPEVQRATLLHAFQTDPSTPLMIATDLMARGVDLPQVQHVVLCELPLSRADYLHRVGRVGRAGLQKSRGRVTIVIGSRQVAHARLLLAPQSS